MSSVGKLIFGFFILATCMVGAVMIFAQQSNTPLGNLTIGNMSEYTCTTSNINQTAGLVTGTSSIISGGGVAVLFIFAAIIIIAALSMFVRRR